MLSSVFENDDVLSLLSKVSSNPRYYDKKKKDSINYEKFSGLEQPMFLLFDALFKYQIIIRDDTYLRDYVHHLELLWYKIDNFHDISEGVCKILVKFCAKKLGYKMQIEEHRREILEYIYQKYIVEGYLFHGISDVYVSTIKKEGFSPQLYENYYPRFLEIQKQYPAFFSDMDFHHDYVSFTDDFVMACYYATYSPIYFSNFLCPSSSKKLELNSYAKRDYMGCFRNLRNLLKTKEINEEDSKKIETLCHNQWKLLKRNESCPTIMLVKRSVFGKNVIHGINEILEDGKEDIGILAHHIMDYKFDSLSWNLPISSSNIEFVSIPYASFVVNAFKEEDSDSIEVIIPNEEDNTEDGKVSFLLLLGSVLILTGVLFSVIMLYQ